MWSHHIDVYHHHCICVVSYAERFLDVLYNHEQSVRNVVGNQVVVGSKRMIFC